MDDETKRVLCMGRVISEYISNEISDDIEKVQSWSTYPGGSAANVAFGLAKLKCPVSFIGCVGEDKAGADLIQALKSGGIDTAGVRVIPKFETGWLWTLRHPNGDRTFHAPQVSFENFADAQLSEFDIDIHSLENVTYFVPQAAHLGPKRCREALWFCHDSIKKLNGSTVFDVNYRGFSWTSRTEAREATWKFAKKSDYIKFSVEEAALLFEETSIIKLGKMFPDARGLLLTKGENGCDFLINGFQGSLPGFAVPTVDTTGAGDAFIAGFVSRLMKFGEEPLKTADGCTSYVRFANAAGAICISKMGAVNSLPTEEEVERLISSL